MSSYVIIFSESICRIGDLEIMPTQGGTCPIVLLKHRIDVLDSNVRERVG